MNKQDKEVVQRVRSELQHALAVPREVKELLFDLGCYQFAVIGYVARALDIQRQDKGDTLDDFNESFMRAWSELSYQEAFEYYFEHEGDFGVV